MPQGVLHEGLAQQGGSRELPHQGSCGRGVPLQGCRPHSGTAAPTTTRRGRLAAVAGSGARWAEGWRHRHHRHARGGQDAPLVSAALATPPHVKVQVWADPLAHCSHGRGHPRRHLCPPRPQHRGQARQQEVLHEGWAQHRRVPRRHAGDGQQGRRPRQVAAGTAHTGQHGASATGLSLCQAGLGIAVVALALRSCVGQSDVGGVAAGQGDAARGQDVAWPARRPGLQGGVHERPHEVAGHGRHVRQARGAAATPSMRSRGGGGRRNA